MGPRVANTCTTRCRTAPLGTTGTTRARHGTSWHRTALHGQTFEQLRALYCTSPCGRGIWACRSLQAVQG
eukprot:5069887-Pyramimonas_sp.AAC.1